MTVRRPPERLAVDGPAGKIEVVIDHPSVFPSEGADEPARGIGLVAHPHPLFGGTLDNKVAQTLALGRQLDVIGRLVRAQGCEFAVQGGDLDLGVAGVGAQTAGADLFVAVPGLQLFEVVLDRGGGRQGREGDQDGEDGGAVHQSR